jgi:hypothetical protein
VFAGVRQVAEKGCAQDELLFVALLSSGLLAATFALAGKISLAVLSCVLAVPIGVGLWIGDGREGAVRSDGLGKR